MDEKPREYTVQEKPGITPDVWLTPTQVWEVKAADLSISPVHKAAEGLVHESKGIALRFPRFLRIREDKNPEDATDATQVRQVMKCMWTRLVRPGWDPTKDSCDTYVDADADTLYVLMYTLVL